jgi:hypothetical protein
MRLERENAGRQSERARLGDQPLQHGVMAAVHAIEVADSEPHAGGIPSMAVPRLDGPVRDLHQRV